uniref:GH18 domain-containing protein n=1 Tax=Panagrolaimus sp. ES5 TaxID=591445 RepID=A0AC34GTP3_9BILA
MFLKIYICVFCFAFLNQVASAKEYIRGCYFSNWAHYRQGIGKYEPEDYIPGLCTHIFFAFGKLSTDFTVTAFDPEDLPSGANGGYFARINALKLKQPGLKTLLSIGGWNAGTENFKDLKNVSNEKLVTIATASDPAKIDAGYDVPEIAKYVDFVNVMTYDFHGSWEQKTGQNSPLYALEGDSTKFNTADAMKEWKEKGMPSKKLILGIATYGRGWILNDPSDSKCGAPGSAAPGKEFTNSAGLAAYYEICKMNGNRKWDNSQKVPYIVKDNLWYGYDDVESVSGKMKWLKENGFGGAFVWALDMDDFNGICDGGKRYPLLNAINDGLGGKEITVTN